MDAAIVKAFRHLQGNYKFQTANYVLFIYDHLLTLPEEVEKVWSQSLTFATLLFYINRYITHCQFLILQVEFYETNWPISVYASNFLVEVCDRYVRFAGAATASLVAVAELVMILRVYGLYLANKYILVFLLSILSGQIIVTAWAVHFGVRVPLPPGFPGCVLTGDSTWFTGLWGAPLVTDTCIFLLTLWRTLRYRKSNGFTSTVEIILRDGTIYFFAIFSVNLMNCLIYLLAEEDLKAMGASFSQILTSILISRLQLNLRRSPPPNASSLQIPMRPSFNHSSRQKADISQTTTTFFTIGNLGAEVEDSFLDTMRGDFDETKTMKDGDGMEMELVVSPESTPRSDFPIAF